MTRKADVGELWQDSLRPAIPLPLFTLPGEAGIPGKSHGDAADVRTRESMEACKILGTKPVFAGQIDGESIMNNEWVKKLKSLLDEEKPDIVFTHWPIDSHKDHQIASLLTIQCWVRADQKFELYFFEVCTGEQTFLFKPTDYVDISETNDQKKKAVYCHVSQDPPGIYRCGHAIMEEFRGRELGVSSAEAFVRMTGQKTELTSVFEAFSRCHIKKSFLIHSQVGLQFFKLYRIHLCEL